MKLRNNLIALGAAAVLVGATAGYVFAAPHTHDGTESTPQTMHGMPSGGMGAMMDTGTGMMGMGTGMMGTRSGMTGMGPGMMGMGSGMMAGGFMGSAQLDAIKSELVITDAQEPAWTAYVQALHDAAAVMQSNRQDMGKSMDDMAKMSAKDRQAFMEKMWQQGQATRNSVKAAADKLVASLDGPQKDNAQRLLPGLAGHGPGMMAQIGMGGHCMGQSASDVD